MRLFTLGIALLASSLALAAESGPSTNGALRVTKPGGGVVNMPLKHTRVSIEVSAFVARTTVEQVFLNPFPEPVEAVYTFPLGDRAAVNDFELTVADRTIRGEIKRREEARAVYEAARSAGYQAALLEQERPNVFTQSVANLEPGKEITVRLRTVETLRYERGVYRLTFPLVVGPKYVPGGAVSDAARINPPVLRPGTRSGHDVAIEVVLDAGVPISGLTSPSHRIVSDLQSKSRARIRLAEDDAIPNKDFLLRWSVASERPAVGFLAHRDGLDGFYTFLVQPKGEIDAAEAVPKEIVFVLDTSGSMSGIPIEASKRLVSKALHQMGRSDTFNLIRFAGDNEAYSPTFRPNAPQEIARALAWIEGQRGGGGTELLAALRAAFVAPADPNRVRVVVFLTDGYVGDDARILDEIGKVLGQARIYTIGIGSSVNHYLLDRMADLGRGAYVFVRPDESADDALEAFRSWVTKPYLTDLSIDWGTLAVADFGSERLRDLGSGQTMTLVGRYLAAGEGDVTVRGKLAGRYWEQKVHVVLPEKESRNAALAALWARGRIEELLLGSPLATAAVRAEVTALALEYRLMSPFTSFVAVDDARIVNPGGSSPTVQQAVPIPDGVSFEGIFGKDGPELREVEIAAPKEEPHAFHALGSAGRGDAGVMPAVPAPFPVAGQRVAKMSRSLPQGLVEQEHVGGTEPAEHLREAACRVLADLADDGKLSPAEGRPAVAALLAAQQTNGAIAHDLAIHAVATWALAEAALALSDEPMVAAARSRAVDHLAAASSRGPLDPDAARWARLVLGAVRPGAASSIAVPSGEASPDYARVRKALAGAAAARPSGRRPFDRLIAAIGKKNLRVVRA